MYLPDISPIRPPLAIQISKLLKECRIHSPENPCICRNATINLYQLYVQTIIKSDVLKRLESYIMNSQRSQSEPTKRGNKKHFNNKMILTFLRHILKRGFRYRAHCLKVATLDLPRPVLRSASGRFSSSCSHSKSNRLKNTKILSSSDSSSKLAFNLCSLTHIRR